MDQLPANEQLIAGYDNKHDHGGYKVSELFVNAKYGSFKDEIANYENFDIVQYKQAHAKATMFIKSEKVKKITAKYTDYKHMFLHYGIAFGAILLFGHILSLILYTDYSKLSSAFSSTFRQIHNFETLKNIKRRNAAFFWMSKFLRELVECFGQCSVGDVENGKWVDRMYGPFYCGMNIKLTVDSFAMRLNSPSSTSLQLAVAVKFSGPMGVVFTFNNPDEWQYQFLRAFDCSFISNFKEEDERLFFGGFYRIKVVNVRLIKTKKNMQKFVMAMCEFDKALTGNYFEEDTKNGFLIIDSLIKLCLEKETNKVILPSFIVDCFRAFVKNKKEICLDMYKLCVGDAHVNKLLVHSLDNRYYDEEIKRSDDDLSNVIRSDIFSLFTNARLIIDSTYDTYSFSFSLIALLNAILETNLNEIIIKSKEFRGFCWIKSVWDSDKEILKKEYAAKGYDIDVFDECNVKINKL